MDFRKIETFLRLAKRLNYSQTAQELFISQSAVSQHIKSLEDELGFRLLDRKGAKVLLTREGEIMEKTFRAMLNRYERGIEEVVSAAAGETTIFVGYPCDLYWMNMPEFIKRFKRRHGVEIQLRIGYGSDDVPPFAEGKTDVLFANDLRLQGLRDCVRVQIVKVGLNVVLPPDHPLAKQGRLQPRDLRPYTVFGAEGVPGDVYLNQLNQTIRNCGIDPDRLRLVPHREDVISAVATGRGIGLAPANAPFGEGGNLVTVPFDAPEVYIQYGCAIHDNASPLVRLFMKEAVEFLKKQQ